MDRRILVDGKEGSADAKELVAWLCWDNKLRLKFRSACLCTANLISLLSIGMAMA